MKFTNTAKGMRGVVMKDGSTIWIDAGEEVDINKTDIAKDHPEVVESRKAKSDDAE